LVSPTCSQTQTRRQRIWFSRRVSIPRNASNRHAPLSVPSSTNTTTTISMFISAIICIFSPFCDFDKNNPLFLIEMVDENDAVVASMKTFPYIIIGIAVTIVVLVRSFGYACIILSFCSQYHPKNTFQLLIAFRSALTPIRVIATLGITLCWSYGFASMIFCTRWFDWLTPSMRCGQKKISESETDGKKSVLNAQKNPPTKKANSTECIGWRRFSRSR
jgi:hypothetical protein